MLALLSASGLAQQVRVHRAMTIPADGGYVCAAAFSPDGAWLATGGGLGDLRVLDAASGKVRWSVSASSRFIEEIQFSPDGERVLCRGRDVTIHDAATGRERLRLPDLGHAPVAWLGRGEHFVYGAESSLWVHDGHTATVRLRCDEAVRSIAVRDVGGEIFFGGSSGRVWRLPADEAKASLHLQHQTDGPHSVGMLKLFAAGGELFTLLSLHGRTRGIHRGSDLFELPHSGLAAAVAKDGRRFAVAGGAGVRWWTAAGEHSADLRVHGAVAALAMRADGSRLFVATYERHQAIYDQDGGSQPIPGALGVRDSAMTPDGTAVAVLGSGWTLHPLDGRESSALDAIGVRPGRRDSDLLVCRDDRLVVLDSRTGKEHPALQMPGGSARAVLPGPGDLWCRGLELLDAEGAVRAALPLPSVPFAPTICHATNGSWAFGGDAGYGKSGLVLADASAKQLRLVESLPVYSLAFSDDGSKLYYCCGVGLNALTCGGPSSCQLRVRDTATLALLQDQAAVAWQWRFLDAKRALVLADQLQVWDVERLQPMQTLPARGMSFQLSADRRTLMIPQDTEVHVYRVVLE